MKFVSLVRARDGKHKWKITIQDGTESHKIKFGAVGYADFTMHKSESRKERYILRHRATENWNDPLAAGTLSRFILWNKPTLKASLADYLDRFGIKK